jgi:hypothetical protein
MPKRRDFRRSSTRLLSVLMILLGIALVARTLSAGGGVAATGIVLGALFMLAGAARLYLLDRGQ